MKLPIRSIIAPRSSFQDQLYISGFHRGKADRLTARAICCLYRPQNKHHKISCHNCANRRRVCSWTRCRQPRTPLLQFSSRRNL